MKNLLILLEKETEVFKIIVKGPEDLDNESKVSDRESNSTMLKYEIKPFEYAWFDNNLCCMPCYQSISLRCYGCKEDIDYDYVTLESGRYHPYCVIC